MNSAKASRKNFPFTLSIPFAVSTLPQEMDAAGLIRPVMIE